MKFREIFFTMYKEIPTIRNYFSISNYYLCVYKLSKYKKVGLYLSEHLQLFTYLHYYSLASFSDIKLLFNKDN